MKKYLHFIPGGCGGVKILRELSSLLFNNTADETGLLSAGNGERSLGGCGGGDSERRRVEADGGDDDVFGMVDLIGSGGGLLFVGGGDDDVELVVARAGAGGGTGDAFDVREGSGGPRFGNAGGVVEIEVSTLDAMVLTRFFETVFLFNVTGGITRLDARLSPLGALGRPPGKGGVTIFFISFNYIITTLQFWYTACKQATKANRRGHIGTATVASRHRAAFSTTSCN
ncbi:267_t:CDS:2 [Racocetra fulgida]|uniref:267_t:CDS:1 n=1 Tax=Racocetra fulgida TaxID=60492 RepID=A0A9N8WGN3_9GLOM|nr:267_t:CDS:2 [Racocetra fulgida]